MARRTIRSVSTSGEGREGNCYSQQHTMLGLAGGRRGKTEGKQDAGVRQGASTFVIKMEMRPFVDGGVSASHCLPCQPSERLL